MRLHKLIHVVIANLFERKTRTGIAIFVIAFAVAVVMVIASLGFGFLRGAAAKAEQTFPPGMLVVKPRALNVSFLAFNTGIIDDSTVEHIRELRGVEYVAPQLSIKVPMRAQAVIVGHQAESDVVIVGIDPVIVRDDVKPGYRFEYEKNTSSPIPCIVPQNFMLMYNMAYSESMGLPKITEAFAVGKTFELYLGESLILEGFATQPQKKKKKVICEIVGLTANPSLLSGALIPLGYAREFNRWYTGREIQNYSALHVKMKEISLLDDVTSRIQDMGLVVESNRDLLQRFQFVTRAAALLTGVFGFIVVAIAAASIVNTFSLILNQRRGEVGLLRAVGASRGIVTGLFMTEVASIGFLGGLLGALASWGVLRWADQRIISMLPKVSFLPEHLFLTHWGLIAACVFGAVALSVFVTLPIILRTTSSHPAVLISEA